MVRPPRKRKSNNKQDDMSPHQSQKSKPNSTINNSSSSNASTNNNKKSFVCAGCNESVIAKNKFEFKMIHAQHKQCCLSALFHCPGNDCNFFGMTMEHLRIHAAYKTSCNNHLSVELSNQNRVHNFSSTGTSFLSNISNSASQPIMNWDSKAASSNIEQDDNYAIPSIVDQQGFAHHSNLVGVSRSGTVKRGLLNVIFQGTPTISTSPADCNGPLSNTHIHSDAQTNFDNEYSDNDSNSNVSAQASPDSDNQSFTMSEEASLNHIDDSKLLCMDKILLNNLKMASFDSSYVCFLELESTLRKASVPNNVFDKVMRWAISNSDTLANRSELFTRKKLYLDSSKYLYGSLDEEMRPKQNIIKLPSGRLVAVTTFDIISQIYSLLECPYLNKGGLKNTIFQYGDCENPFRLPVDDIGSSQEDSHFDDVETCLWYINTYLGLNLQKLPKEILVPIIGFLDSTVLNGQSSHNIEPFMFTLGIFKRIIRNHPKAWRSLGFLEDLFRIIGTSSMSAQEKMEDYHFILDHLMKGLKDLSTSGGLLWTFTTNDGTRHTVRLHFRLMMIIGDTKGADVWVGRYGSHTNTSGLCRDCTMLTKDADNPHCRCKINRFSEIEQLDEAGLARLSMRRIKHNAFKFPKELFGASPYGVCVACPPEPLHVFLLGTIIRVFQFLTDQFTTKQVNVFQRELTIVCNQDMGQSGKKMFPSMSKFSSGNYDIGHLTGVQKYARIFAMYLTLLKTDVHNFFKGKKGKVPSRVKKPPKAKKTSENNGKAKSSSVGGRKSGNQCTTPNDEPCLLFRNDSDEDHSDSDHEDLHLEEDDDLDETVTRGYNEEEISVDRETVKDTRDQLTASDETESHSAPKITTSPPVVPPKAKALLFTEEVYNDLVFILEECLIFYRWLVSARHCKRAFKGGRNSPVARRCRKFMDDYKRIAPRLEGMGLKLVKFHHLSHWYFYIQLYGSPLNFDGAPPESMHKENVKDVGRRTQQRSGTLTYQTGIRTYEKTLEERCSMQCNIWESDEDKDPHDSSIPGDPIEDLDLADTMDGLLISKSLSIDSRILGPYFRLDFDYIDCDPESKTDCMKIVWLERRDGKPRKIPLPSFDKQTMNAFHQKMRYYNCGKPGRRLVSILGGTGLVVDNREKTVIRATPSYRSGRQWFDYVNYDWGSNDEGTLPAKVKIIFDYSTMIFEDLPQPLVVSVHSSLRGSHETLSGIKIMIHSTTPSVNPHCWVKSRVCTRYIMENEFQVVSPLNVNAIAFCLPDAFDAFGNLTSVLHVRPLAEWSSLFFDYKRNALIESEDSESSDSRESELEFSFTDIE